MTAFTDPITDIIRRRYSCRSYRDFPLDPEQFERLAEYAAELGAQANGSGRRFEMVAANLANRDAFGRLGTYGFIRGASGYLIGVVPKAFNSLEEFGCQMEKWVLLATDLGLGTCWLGGTFTRSSFMRQINAENGETIPAAIACGVPAENRGSLERIIRKQAGSDGRLDWNALFFKGEFGEPLSQEAAGDFALPLEMVRLGPSASNKQPWRILRSGRNWHFLLQRTPGYRERLLNRMFTQADLQRIDMGIAMCHFELTCRQLGLDGGWAFADPGLDLPTSQVEYTISWVV